MAKKPYIKKGDLVEFTDDYYRDYTTEVQKRHAKYGVAISDYFDYENVKVMISNDQTIHARHIQAHSWIGWVPDGLEYVYEKLQPYDPEFDD